MPKVIALKPCFVGGARRSIGDVFLATDAQVKEHDKRLEEKRKAGSKTVKPTFKVVTDERAAKAEAEKVKQDEAKRLEQGAIAASGGAAAKARADTARDLAG